MKNLKDKAWSYKKPGVYYKIFATTSSWSDKIWLHKIKPKSKTIPFNRLSNLIFNHPFDFKIP